MQNKKREQGRTEGGREGGGGRKRQQRERGLGFFFKKNTGTDAYLWPCVRDALCDKGK